MNLTTAHKTHHIPSLSRALRRTFWNVYDNLLVMILLSLLWLPCAFTLLFLPAGTASIYRISYRLINNEKVKVGDFFILLPKYFIKSTLLALFFLILMSAIFFNIHFYITHLGLAGIILAGISFWLAFLLIIAGVYIFPSLTTGNGYKTVLKKSFLFALSNIKFSFGFALLILCFLILEMILPILGIGTIAVFSHEAFREISAKYNTNIKITNPARSIGELISPWSYHKQ